MPSCNHYGVSRSYIGMKAIIETQSFLDSVQAYGISNDLKMIMVETIAAEPNVGDLMVGTGGCRKRRFAGRGKGKWAATAPSTTTVRTTFRCCCWW